MGTCVSAPGPPHLRVALLVGWPYPASVRLSGPGGDGIKVERQAAPQALYGVLDQSVELSCGEINSTVTFLWTFIALGTNLTIPIAWKDLIYEEAAQLGIVSLIDSTLVIDKLTLQAEGQFMCVAWKVNLPPVYVDLIVLVPVIIPSLKIDNEKPIEGTAVHMTCTVEVGTRPVTYIWQRHSVFEGSFKVQEGTDNMLLLSPVSREHTGWYTCTVRNMVNDKISGRLSLDVVYGPDEPIITIEPYAISENGFAANELEKVILNCTASSNPPCEYIWFYNNSQMDTGQMYIFPKISRTQTGLYTCLAKNLHLDTRTQLTITLTVFYLPEGYPRCTALPHNRYQDVALWCSWPGGLPLAQLYWMKQSEEDNVIVSKSNATLVKRGTDLKNSTSFYCTIFHPSLKKNYTCSTTVVMPSGGPNCSAVATKLNEFIMLTCEWTGGLPRITLEWNNGEVGDIKESSNIYVFKPDRTYNGRLFTCTALHPMITVQTECHIQLEAPVLDSPSMANSILEGNSVQMVCNLKLATPSSEVTWYDNNNQEIISDSQKFGIYKENGMSNLTVHETEWGKDSGLYRCMASNAVGNSSLLMRLTVNKYPTPPNVSISKLIYSRQRTEVDLEWMTQGAGDLTGFMVQRQASIRSAIPKRSVQTVPWDIVANEIEPDIRGHKLGGLDPSILYAFRILAVNHKTTGFPSEVKTPADPPNNIYPAAIGAGFAGMLVAAVACLLVFQYIARNRQNHPRLHDWFFRASAADARENIRHPEDAETSADADEGATASPEPTPAPEAPAQEAAEGSIPGSPDVALSEIQAAADEPVNVTITVTATS